MTNFFIENKIYYHDTDSGGVMYYGAYLEHLEEGRAEFCKHKGVDLVDMSRKGVIFPVVHFEIDYKYPARYGDKIAIFTEIERVGNASVCLMQEIKIGETLIAKARTVWACVGVNMRPKQVPDEVRQALLKKD